MEKTIHHGRNVKRFREMLGIKQGAFAADMGDEWSQDKISRLEQKEEIEDKLLEQIAHLLKVPVEAIKNFDEEKAVNVISNTFNCTDFKDNSSILNINPVFDPIDKIVRLHEEKIVLYERMLKEKDEMMERMERLMEKK